MSKSILVIDTPEQTCQWCKLCYESEGSCDDYICAGTGKLVPDGEKPDWCPLKPVPDKLDDEIDDYEEKYYIGGWNECIDEILKGSDGNE